MPGTSSGPIANTIRVLVIEDDQDYITLLQDLLHDAKRMRFAVTATKACEEGLKEAQKNAYHVILLDHKLPDGEGLELIPKLLPLASVVMVTSHGDRTLQSRALEAGAVEYLEKGSFTADLLERTCLYAADKKLSAAAPVTPPPRSATPAPAPAEPVEPKAAPNSGVVIQELLFISREAVRVQTEAGSQIKELRKDLEALQKAVEQNQKDIIGEIQGLAKGRWMLEWVSKHPVAAILLFFGTLLVLVLFIGALDVIDLGKLAQLLNIARG